MEQNNYSIYQFLLIIYKIIMKLRLSSFSWICVTIAEKGMSPKCVKLGTLENFRENKMTVYIQRRLALLRDASGYFHKFPSDLSHNCCIASHLNHISLAVRFSSHTYHLNKITNSLIPTDVFSLFVNFCEVVNKASLRTTLHASIQYI